MESAGKSESKFEGPQRFGSPVGFDPMWMPYLDLFINPDLFKKGLVVVSTQSHHGIDCEQFHVNEREFRISSMSSAHQSAQRRKASLLLSQLLAHTTEQSGSTNIMQGSSYFLSN